MSNYARPQISTQNIIKVMTITGRPSHDFDASLSEVLSKYQKLEDFYKNFNGVKNEL